MPTVNYCCVNHQWTSLFQGCCFFYLSNFTAHPWCSFVKSSSCHQSPQNHQQQSSRGCEGHCPGAQRDSSVRGQWRDWPGRGRAALWRHVQGLPGLQPRWGMMNNGQGAPVIFHCLHLSFFCFCFFQSFAFGGHMHAQALFTTVFILLSIYRYVIDLNTSGTLFLFKW